MSRQLVYFAQCDFGGPIKIGCSYTPHGRLDVIGPEMPFELVLIGTVEGSFFIESFLHMWFRNIRIRGEWFQPHPELRRTALEARTQGRIHYLPHDVLRSSLFKPPDAQSLVTYYGITTEELAGYMRCTEKNVQGIQKKERTTNKDYIAALCVAAKRRNYHWDPNNWCVEATEADGGAAAGAAS